MLTDPAPDTSSARPPDAGPPAFAEGAAISAESHRIAAPASPFMLRGVRWEGVATGGGGTRTLDPVLHRFLGRPIDAQGLKALVAATAARYARSDVALYSVQAPAQDFARGVVRLRVTEGHVEAVEVRATDARLAARIRAYARPVLAEQPLRRSTLAHALQLMRALPGVVSVEAGVVAGSREDAVRLLLTARRKRVAASAEVRDRGAGRLGASRFTADLTLDALFREGDRTALDVSGSLGSDRFRSVSLVHAQTLGPNGLTLQASFGWLATRPRGWGEEGSARLGGAQLVLPLRSREGTDLAVSAGFDAIDSTDALLGAVLSDERTRTLRAGVSFNVTASPYAALGLGVTASRGVDGLGARPVAAGWSDSGFRKLAVQATAARRFGAWTVRLRGTGQATPDRLPASELLSLGGDAFGRAFDAGVAAGDEGVAVSGELAWAASRALPKPLAGSELYAFADGARARLKSRPEDGLPGQTYDLASAGLGARLALGARAVMQVEASRSLAARLPFGAGDGGWRLVLGLRVAT